MNRTKLLEPITGGNHDLLTIARGKKYNRGIRNTIRDEYNRTSYHNDIGLIEVDVEFNFTGMAVKPACILSESLSTHLFQQDIIIGRLNQFKIWISNSVRSFIVSCSWIRYGTDRISLAIEFEIGNAFAFISFQSF